MADAVVEANQGTMEVDTAEAESVEVEAEA